jgi:hypothetical protein
VSVKLQQLLEAPLLGPEGDAWKNSPRTEMPEGYETWMDAQIDSEAAAGKYANFKDIIFPLEKTKNKVVLENMWKYVNLVSLIHLFFPSFTKQLNFNCQPSKNYKDVSGKDIDSLWELTDALDPSPQWHSFYVPDLKQGPDYDSDSPLDPPSLSKGKKKASRLLAITNGNDSDDSMPELQSVSNSSDEGESDDESDSDADDADDDDSDDSGYDTEQEDEQRDMLREAMDTAHEADWLHSANVPSEIDPFLQEDRKGNPFLKLLGSLRGKSFRVFRFSSLLCNMNYQVVCFPRIPNSGLVKIRSQNLIVLPSPALRPRRNRLLPVGQFGGWQPNVVLTVITPDAAKSYKATVEEVEDEDEEPRTPKKKKKKPKKKKKSTPAEPQQGGLAAAEAAPVPVVKAQSSPVLTPKKVAAPPVSPQKAGFNKSVPSTMSTASLPLGSIEPTTAQSARSYLQSENLDAQRTKIKTRPDYATSFTEKPKKKGVFSKFMGRNKPQEEKEAKGAKHSWFSKLTKKSTGYMHQLLNSPEDETKGIAPMKWEHFLKVSCLVESSFERYNNFWNRSCEKWDLSMIPVLRVRVSVLTLPTGAIRFVE